MGRECKLAYYLFVCVWTIGYTSFSDDDIFLTKICSSSFQLWYISRLYAVWARNLTWDTSLIVINNMKKKCTQKHSHYNDILFYKFQKHVKSDSLNGIYWLNIVNAQGWNTRQEYQNLQSWFFTHLWSI